MRARGGEARGGLTVHGPRRLSASRLCRRWALQRAGSSSQGSAWGKAGNAHRFGDVRGERGEGSADGWPVGTGTMCHRCGASTAAASTSRPIFPILLVTTPLLAAPTVAKCQYHPHGPPVTPRLTARWFCGWASPQRRATTSCATATGCVAEGGRGAMSCFCNVQLFLHIVVTLATIASVVRYPLHGS